MQAVLIENPTALTVDKASVRVAERALAATFDLELVTTEARGHAGSLAREAVESGAKTVIAYGGDGTVNEVVNGMLGAPGSEAVLAVLPGGGTNVLARTLGYPNDLVAATDHLIAAVDRGTPRRISLGHVRAAGPQGPLERLFTFGAGLVLDGDTVRRVERSGLRPRLGDTAFVWCALRSYVALRRKRRPALVLHLPDGHVDAWWAMFGKSKPFTYLGRRGLIVHPEASHEEGLHLAAARSAGFARTLKWVVQALNSGRQVRDRHYIYEPVADRISVEARWPVPLQADGEHLGEVVSAELRSVPDALPVWA